MRIIEDIKLDFSDVLISPKRSQLTSRKDADLSRQFTFKHSTHEWSGVPIIASNMDHTGTVAMAHVLMEYPMLTALCKFVESTEWGWNKNIIRTIGLDQNLDNLLYDSDTAPWICLDVANGYTERFCDYVTLMRTHEATKGKIIIAGNVCTRSHGTDNPCRCRYCENWYWAGERMYHKENDWRWLSTTFSNDRVC